MHTKPCRAGPPIFPLIIISLDDFCCLAINSQVTTHFFLQTIINIFDFCTCMHLVTTTHLGLAHPSTIPWPCATTAHHSPTNFHHWSINLCQFSWVCTCVHLFWTHNLRPSTFPLPSTHLPGIPALVPRGAKCTAGMASWLCLALHGLGAASCIQCGTFHCQTHAKPC